MNFRRPRKCFRTSAGESAADAVDGSPPTAPRCQIPDDVAERCEVAVGGQVTPLPPAQVPPGAAQGTRYPAAQMAAVHVYR